MCVCVGCRHSSSKFDEKQQQQKKHGKEITLSVRVSIARALVRIHMPVFIHLWLRSMCVRHSRVRRKIRSFYCRPSNERTPFARPFVSSDFFFFSVLLSFLMCCGGCGYCIEECGMFLRFRFYQTRPLRTECNIHPLRAAKHNGEMKWEHFRYPNRKETNDVKCDASGIQCRESGMAQEASASFGLLFQRVHFMFFDAICDYQMPELQHVGCIGRTADVNIKMSKKHESLKLEFITGVFAHFDGGKRRNHECRERGGQKKWNFIASGAKKRENTWRKILHLLEPIRRIFMIAETTTVA